MNARSERVWGNHDVTHPGHRRHDRDRATTFVNATLDTPGGTSTGFSYTFTPGIEVLGRVVANGPGAEVPLVNRPGTVLVKAPSSVRPRTNDESAR